MFTLMKLMPIQRFLAVQAPTLVGSLVIAELFYKFGSFLLEAGAFLGTWFLLDLVVSLLLPQQQREREDIQA